MEIDVTYSYRLPSIKLYCVHTMSQKLFIDSLSKISLFILNIIFLAIYEAEYIPCLLFRLFFVMDSARHDPFCNAKWNQAEVTA